MTPGAVPVIVVAGYLGSGKTTLLNHLLRVAGPTGTRIGVLVNDFGAVNIDALLVSGQADGTVSLGNGCMCCSVDADGLGDALGALLRPSAGLDAIVIEASGIAEPKALIRMVTGIADRRMRYGGLIYVVDAAHVDDVRAVHPELDGHVAIADLIVLNKADLVADDVLIRVSAQISSLNPTAPHLRTVDAALDPALLFDVTRRRAATEDLPVQLTLDALLTGEQPAHDHLHADYQSVSFESAAPMNPRRLALFLERPPEGCFRIKGIVHFDIPRHRGRYVVHAVGGFVRVQRDSWGAGSPATSIVAIGAGLDVDAVLRELGEAVAEPQTVDDQGVLAITRYLES
ncbi:GTP-binding protein [Gordonia sp. ABSL1-1]|uniref:CobW family GTP-binding protein n=1 Tax=Gordonia sp. ABSL1-1 TaxID=3053923 RepID=UPI002572D734|nr:GTP-binding protein [Gordonia sp. ABSL1-1]MDL9935764.1 GTP-binding protein [Gordonia sp. ABSL1-1]